MHALNDDGFRVTGSKASIEHFKSLCEPKIKMAKTLPDEVGLYYYSPNTHIGNIKILTLSESRQAGDFITDSSWFARASELRGYWARVDQSMFEFEGE